MEKVFVDENNRSTIICHKCGLNKNMDVAKFKDTHRRIKAKCKCGEIFQFILEFRQSCRKNLRLAGEYFVRGKKERGDILIDEISASGIRFASLKPHNISKDDLVELKFTLNNSWRTEVQELVKIIRIKNRNVGARYTDQSRLKRIWFFT
jgi:hypothetical protein